MNITCFFKDRKDRNVGNGDAGKTCQAGRRGSLNCPLVQDSGAPVWMK